jgi:hypothetical protein
MGGDEKNVSGFDSVGKSLKFIPLRLREFWGFWRHAVACGELFLGEAERPADDPDLRHSGCGAQQLLRQRRIVGIGKLRPWLCSNVWGKPCQISERV